MPDPSLFFSFSSFFPFPPRRAEHENETEVAFEVFGLPLVPMTPSQRFPSMKTSNASHFCFINALASRALLTGSCCHSLLTAGKGLLRK